MLHVHVICSGKLKEHFYVAACGEYAKRLSAFCKLQISEVADGQEMKMLPLIGARDFVAALCIEGKSLSSPDLAEKLGKIQQKGTPLTLLIGGSEGLPEDVKARADVRLSMSPMTFPHHLARVMVLEQLYRSFAILKGSRYHK